MKVLRSLLVVWVIGIAGIAPAQDSAPASAASAGPDSLAGREQAADRQAAEREWVPDGVAELGRSASARTEFRLDHSMLALVSKLDRDNQDLRRVLAGVNGVSVHNFRFAAGSSPDAAAMESIGRQYQQAGWMHVVSKRKNNEGGTADLWIRMEELAIRDVAVLMVRAREVDFVSVSGTLSPLDLMHLSGHFGIPKMDGGFAVPAPGAKP